MRFLTFFLIVISSQTVLADDWLYLTYPGDTPIKIGHDYLKNTSDWKKVLELNHIANQYVVPVNTRIRIPVELLKVTPAPVLVTHVTGNVRVKPAGGGFRRLIEGDQLNGGETVLTGPNSFAGFKLADGSLLSEQASSRLSFGRLAAYGKTGMVSTELNLEGGRLEAGASKQIGPAGGFRVITPVAVAGLRGTAFRLNVSEDGKTLRNEVLQGVVGVTAENQEVLVAKGQGTVAELGKPPEPPRLLLPAPSLEGIPQRVIDLPLVFSWPRMANAIGWRAQVASDPDFRDILLDGSSETPQIKWNSSLPDGHYFLRVRAIDIAGLEGLNADMPFELDARPLPPIQIEPGQASRVYQEDVPLSWAAAQEATGYLLQIAPSADFPADHTLERKLDAVLGHTEKLAPGTYFWRIASMDDAGAHGWSPVHQFVIKLPPAAPKGEASTHADIGQADFAWQAADNATSYDLEIARKIDFANPEVREHLTDTRFATQLKPGNHYWRLRSLESDGHAGAWGKPSPLIMPPITPANVQVLVGNNNIHIRWRGAAPAYRLEFARDPEFRRPLFNHRQVGNASSLERPEPGQYWVRVIALSDDNALGGESKPVLFNVFGW
jgi:hypothetical protein